MVVSISGLGSSTSRLDPILFSGLKQFKNKMYCFKFYLDILDSYPQFKRSLMVMKRVLRRENAQTRHLLLKIERTRGWCGDRSIDNNSRSIKFLFLSPIKLTTLFSNTTKIKSRWVWAGRDY